MFKTTQHGGLFTGYKYHGDPYIELNFFLTDNTLFVQKVVKTDCSYTIDEYKPPYMILQNDSIYFDIVEACHYRSLVVHMLTSSIDSDIRKDITQSLSNQVIAYNVWERKVQFIDRSFFTDQLFSHRKDRKLHIHVDRLINKSVAMLYIITDKEERSLPVPKELIGLVHNIKNEIIFIDGLYVTDYKHEYADLAYLLLFKSDT